MKSALLAGVFMGPLVLGACSQVPDAVNPVEWYKSTTDFFSGDKADKKQDAGKESGLAADRGKAPPGSDKAFPNLSSVDRQAQSRDKKGGGLIADPDRPKYAPAIARQGSSSDSLASKPRAKASRSVAATMPPPAAAPTAPVTPVPMKAPAPAVMAQAPAPAKTMTAQAPAAASPQLAPPNLTIDQQETEKRLARQLADLRARAQADANAPAPQPFTPTKGEFDTVVISSDGIQSADALETQESVPVAPVSPPTVKGGSQLIERPAARASGPGVKVATILFANGSSNLKAHDKRILSAVTRLQKKRGGVIRIIGHASSRTRSMSPVKHKMANFKISVDRADKVVSELVRLGIKNENIEIAAVSDTEPLYYEFMPTGEAGNRRTEVYLVN